ncbi:MAG: phosphopantetheine-binding protein [Planctomycetales bacterium]
MTVDPEVMEKVQSLVTDMLGVERDEVTPETMFSSDLGGDSLDLLDMGFRCERAFGAKVRFQDLSAFELEVEEDGALTEPSLEQLQTRFPHVDVSHWRGKRFNRPLELLSISDLAAIVQGEIARSHATSA